MSVNEFDTTEHRLIEKIMMGDSAQNVMQTEVFTKVWPMLEERYTEQMLNTAPEDDALRWKLTCKINALREVKNLMTSFITTGKTAKQRRRSSPDRQKT